MKRGQGHDGWLRAVSLLLTAGCSVPAGSGPEHKPSAPARQTPAVSQEADVPGERTIALRAALVPDTTPQPVRIRVQERRETIGEGFDPLAHELRLDLAATVVRTATEPDGGMKAKLVFKRIRLEFGSPDRPGAMFTYDSAADKPGKGNTLADIMSHVAGAELSLGIGPSGRLGDLQGLDHRWRRANLVMAPPGLLLAQWMFRDASMSELASEALFPPMPAHPVRVGDTWEVDLPANIPLAARLTSHVRGELTSVSADRKGQPLARIEAQGTIKTAPEILEGRPPALRPIVRSGSLKIVQTIGPASHSLRQVSQRAMEVLLTLTPPAGEQRQQMTIKQTRTLTATRGEPTELPASE